MLKQAHLYITGDVIGVGFRAWTKILAKKMGVKGWVKNVERHVEAVLQGEEKMVNEMIEILKAGAPISRVDDVEIVWEEVEETSQEFEIVK